MKTVLKCSHPSCSHPKCSHRARCAQVLPEYLVEYEYVMQPGAGSGGGSQTYNQLTASSLTPRGKRERHWRIMTPPATSCR